MLISMELLNAAIELLYSWRTKGNHIQPMTDFTKLNGLAGVWNRISILFQAL